MKLSLLGYYGYGNFGDDWILASLLHGLERMPSVSRVNVLVRDDTYSNQPHFNPGKARYLPTRRFRDKLAKYRLLFDSDLFVWGGGTCLYEPGDGDIRGMESFLRNIRLFRIAGKPYGFLGIGMGELASGRSRRITGSILKHASFVTFRDPASMDIARGVTDRSLWQRFELCGDPFLLSGDRMRMLRKADARRPMTRIAFCGHLGLADREPLVRFYADLLDRLMEETGASVSCVPMQSWKGMDDNRFHEQLKGHIRHRDRFKVHTYDSMESLIALLEEVDFLIGMRLHSILLADVLGIPSLGIETMPKVGFYLSAFPEACSRRAYGLMEPFTPANILEVEEACWKERNLVEQTLEKLRQGAERNLSTLESALRGRLEP